MCHRVAIPQTEALAVFEGVDKDTVTFNAAITACSKATLPIFNETVGVNVDVRC